MEFGAAYVLTSAEQFWSELDDILAVNVLAPLVEHDSSLKSYITFAATYLGEYLREDEALWQCVDQLLASRLFGDHSQRMVDLTARMLCEVEPSSAGGLLICATTLLRYGRQHPHVFRQLRCTALPHPVLDSSLTDQTYEVAHGGIIPALLLMGIRVGFALDRFVATYHPGRSHPAPTPTPSLEEVQKEFALENVRLAERRMGPVLAALLYEVCRIEKLEADVLAKFDEERITRLFELVELTRDLEDETFNYDLIRLIICLNEQYMIASLPTSPDPDGHGSSKKHHRHVSDADTNVVLKVMKQRLNESKTFGENLIFILNRSSHDSAEGLCVSLLILKILYLLFTNLGTHEYFYTNDLCVLVDVFIRELNNLPEESEGLRHTYLRVLHPLLTKTQLRTYPYKRAEIRHVLLSHVQYAHLRDLNPTTRRLVERNLNAEWCAEMGAVRTNGAGTRRHFGAYTDAPGSSDESLPRAGQANGSSSTGGRGSVVDVTAAISHSRLSAAGTADAPDDFRHAVATIRQHEADEYRRASQDRHARMARASAAGASPPVSPKTVLIEEPDCAVAALAITTPEGSSPVEGPSVSPTSVSRHKSVSLPSTPRIATPPPEPELGYLFAPQHVPSRSLASSPALGARPHQDHVRSVTPTMRRPAPLPPSTRRNGEPVVHRGSPRASAAPFMASSVELDPAAAPHSDPPPQLTTTGRRRPPSPPVARRKPPLPPTVGGAHHRAPQHSVDASYDGSPVDDVVVYNPFVDRRSGTRPPA